MNLTFWGTRGSIACASPFYIKYGGHTSCVSLYNQGKLIIFDAGSGLYDLGVWIQQSGVKIDQVDLLLTHFHYDHAMGLPFFAPLWDPSFHLTVHYAGATPEKGKLKEFISKILFSPPSFPIPFQKVPAQIDFKEYPLESSFTVNSDIKIMPCALNHPGNATGYRLEGFNKVISYITDTEHVVGTPDEKVLKLMHQADLAIYDATYTDEEFKDKEGWGHSTWQEGIRLAKQAQVKQLAFFHHAPDHTDDILTALEQKAQKLWPSCFMAKQGTSLTF